MKLFKAIASDYTRLRRNSALDKISAFHPELSKDLAEKKINLRHIARVLNEHERGLSKEDKKINATRHFAETLRTLINEGYYTDFTATRLKNLFLKYRKKPSNTIAISDKMKDFFSTLKPSDSARIKDYLDFLNAGLQRNKQIEEALEKKAISLSTTELRQARIRTVFNPLTLSDVFKKLVSSPNFREYHSIYWDAVTKGDAELLEKIISLDPKTMDQEEIKKYKEKVTALLRKK
ncbi:hypothetical protein HUU53_01405 [Candidatus Micrarchaeota archaeon]|nr:hypothetical protein [Candidatus Micrarchaeota archaeon]